MKIVRTIHELIKKFMDAYLKNNLITLVLFLLIIPISYFILYQFQFWPLGITNGWYWSSDFGDLKMNLKMISCSSEYGIKIYGADLPDECGRYTYGYLMARLLDLLGVKSSWSSILGITFFVCVVVAMIFVTKVANTNWGTPVLFTFMIFFSPGFWLAIVHGSIDIPVFILLIIAFFLSSKGFALFSYLLLICSVLMKFFTLPLLLLIAVRQLAIEPSHKKRVFLLVSALVTTFYTIYNISLVNYQDSSYRMAEGIFHTFGIKSIPIWMEVIFRKIGYDYIAFSSLERHLIGLFLFMLFCYLFTRLAQHALKFSVKSNRITVKHFLSDKLSSEALLYFGVSCLALFLQGQNYDNKLIFYSIPCLVLYQVIPKGLYRSLFVGLTMIVFWFSCFYPNNLPQTLFVFIEITGDFFSLLLSSLVFLAVYRQIRQIFKRIES